jgi:hypothetical protein
MTGHLKCVYVHVREHECVHMCMCVCVCGIYIKMV